MSTAYSITPSGTTGVGTATLLLISKAQFGSNVPEVVEDMLLTNTQSILYEELKNLASGVNTITPPTAASGVIIIPPAANTQTITLKGIAGDTGVPLNKIAPNVLILATPAAAFVLTTGGIINNVKLLWL